MPSNQRHSVLFLCFTLNSEGYEADAVDALSAGMRGGGSKVPAEGLLRQLPHQDGIA
jgi:hypothetical protein